jgi:hypothetical protein
VANDPEPIEPEEAPPPESPHPIPPTATAAWPGRVVWSVAGVFAAAAVLGPFVARRRPTDPPESVDLHDTDDPEH